MELMSGNLFLSVPQNLLTPDFDDNGDDIADTTRVELNREETLELMRLLRSVRLMEMESQPSFPIKADVNTEDITKQLQTTFVFVRDVLLACNSFQEQGNAKDAEMILTIVRRHVAGFKVVYSHELHSYLLVPEKIDSN